MSDYKKAKDLARNNVVYIDGLASIKEAIQTMKEHNVEALIIQKRNERDANGILVINDIIRGVIVPDKNPEEVSVYELMSKPVISIPADLNVRYVSRYLINANKNWAPIEEGGKYIGIIGLKEILLDGV